MDHLYLTILLKVLLMHISTSSSQYQIGVGIADCTGPAAEIVFMGYAKSKQKGCGIHLRQFSRAFIFKNKDVTAAFVSVDVAMMGFGVQKAIFSNLNKLYGNTYNKNNLIISGTHTHGAPGGFLMDLLLDISTFGFVKQTFDALVSGITKSIVNAHENMVEGKIFVASGELLEANINRSPTSYLLNPKEERDRYPFDVDKEMVQLKFVRSSDQSLIGAINWFAVHPTSMNNTNCLVTSDNVGYASILLEQHFNTKSLIGHGPFVGAFASTNLGDVSPNLKGPKCINTGESCDILSSSCDGHSQSCVASGPGKDMFDSTRIIAEKLFHKAKALFSDPEAREINGPIKVIQQYVDMPKQTATFTFDNNTQKMVHGCSSAMGYSFAAGTTDGPGEFDFTQGTKTTNPFWNFIRDAISSPTKEDIACHHPKPILFNTGKISYPYEWQPQIVSTQLIQLGEVVLIAVPGEFTTMSGRRLRDVVLETFISNGGSRNTRPIITGLSNVYTSYIATPEEYQMQRYEGASTIYGPYTLTIYLKLYRELATALIKNELLNPGPTPPDFSSKLISFTPGVWFDTAGWNRKYGNCLSQPATKVKRGTSVQAKFVAGHPRNGLMHGKSFLYVEKQSTPDPGSWQITATDANWETKFTWKRTSILGGSEVIIDWEIAPDTDPGIYRIRHVGNYKYILGGIYPYEGITRSFTVE